jgi:hypothetical protein
MEVTAIYTVRNGKVREVEYFWDHAEALEVGAERLNQTPLGESDLAE